MNKNLVKMREIAHATNSIRKSLKEQESINKSIREKITPIWDKPAHDEEVTSLSKELTVGRCRVRAAQTALHELKRSFRNHNKRYDRSLRHAAN